MNPNSQKIKATIRKNIKLVAVIGASLVLTITVLVARAGSPFVSFEAEGSDIAGTSLVKSSGEASDAKYVEFTEPEDSSNPPDSSLKDSILWATDHERGSLHWWVSDTDGYNATTGGAYDNANCTRPGYNSSDSEFRQDVQGRGVSTEVAHSGNYSMKMTLDTSRSGGCRQFRMAESRFYDDNGQGLFYSAWLYFPENLEIEQWSNIMQFKSRTSTRNDPIWILQMDNRSNSNMYFTLYWWNGLTIAGPQAGDGVGGKAFRQNIKDVPVGQWTHIEMYMRKATDYTGQITVWQDGVQILDVDNAKTKYEGGDSQWSVNMYAGSVNPTNATIYVDDAAVSTKRIGPDWSDFADL